MFMVRFLLQETRNQGISDVAFTSDTDDANRLVDMIDYVTSAVMLAMEIEKLDDA